MKNLKIQNKIFVLMTVLLFITAVSNLVLIKEMSQINDQSTVIAESWVPSLELSGQIDSMLGVFRVAEYSQLTSIDDAERIKSDNERIAAQKSINDLMAKYKSEIDSEEEAKLFSDFEAAWTGYLALSNEVDSLYESGNKDQAIMLIGTKSDSQYDAVMKQVDNLVAYNKQGSADASAYADKLYTTNKMVALGLLALTVVLGMLSGYLIVSNVAHPIRNITKYMGVLASGDMTKDVPDRDRKDEIGDMASAIQVFKDNMVKAKELEAEQEKETFAKLKRQEKVDAAVKKFELSMADIVRFVASSSTELQASAQSLASSAEQTSKQSGAVAAASHQASANVQTVASATEELTSSINEIASQVARSSEVAGRAVTDAQKAGQSVSELVDAAQKIGEVTAIISGIAEQTNLLALNATIEAARAGDAGKGFAVVASEVKNLANEATKATEEISSQIAHIQSISKISADAINTICRIIAEIDEISGTISAAIQEQTSATQEISRNVSEAYTGTSVVSENIATVSDAANSTGTASHEVLSAADELSRQSEILKKEFDTFVNTLATAA